MRKQVKLPNKDKSTKTTPQNTDSAFYFFVKDQGTGAGTVAVIVLKIIELILTTIYGVMLGIFTPIIIWNGNLVDEAVANDPSAVCWLITSVVYIIGLFVLMLGHSKTAAVIHIIAAAGTITTYSLYRKLFEGYETSGPTASYMPCLFITVITVAVMLIINVPKWIEKRIERDNEQAQSILEVRGKK